MKAWSKKSPIIKSQENNIISATKAMIEKHIAVSLYKNYYDGIIKVLQ